MTEARLCLLSSALLPFHYADKGFVQFRRKRMSQIANGSAARGILGNDNELERGSLSVLYNCTPWFYIFSQNPGSTLAAREQLNC